MVSFDLLPLLHFYVNVHVGDYGDQNDGKPLCPPDKPTWCICKWATASWIKGEGCNEVCYFLFNFIILGSHVYMKNKNNNDGDDKYNDDNGSVLVL